jgi:hypothetical protein
MNDNLEHIKKRVKKLLALSKSPNQNEALAALEKARRLMRDYSLSETECMYTQTHVKATKRLSKWRVVLSGGVAYLNYCEHLRNETTGEIIFYGEEFDAFMAAEMYRYLSKSIERMAKQNIRANAKNAYRDKYKLGIACELDYRIRELGDKVSWLPDGKTKRLAVKKAMVEELKPVISDLKITGRGSGAFSRGLSDGSGISLNRQTTGHDGKYLEGNV